MANINVTPGTGKTVCTTTIGGFEYQNVILTDAAGAQAGAAVVGKVGIDQTTPGTTNGVQLTAGTAVIGAVISEPFIASGSFTRTADTNAYAAGDLIASTITAASVTAANSACIVTIARATNLNGRITGAWLEKTGTGTTGAIFRAHIFGIDPFATVPTNGDNGVFAPAKRASYYGYIDFTGTLFAFGDGVRMAGQIAVGSVMNFIPTSGAATLYGILEARGPYAPASGETFTLTLAAE